MIIDKKKKIEQKRKREFHEKNYKKILIYIYKLI